MTNGRQIARLAQQVRDLLRPGAVAAVDLEQARVRVRYDVDALTAWLPWLPARAGDARSWWAPSVGEQVLVLSPAGRMAAGWVLPAGYTGEAPAPAAEAHVHRTVYPDGAVAEYDAEAHVLTLSLPAGAAVRVAGDVEVAGDLTVSGDVAATGDVMAEGGVAAAAVDDAGGSLSDLRGKYNAHTHAAGLNPTPVVPASRA